MAAATSLVFLVYGTYTNNPERVVERNKEINFRDK